MSCEECCVMETNLRKHCFGSELAPSREQPALHHAAHSLPHIYSHCTRAHSSPPSRLKRPLRSAGRTGSCTQKPRRRPSSGPASCCEWYQTTAGCSPWAGPLSDTSTGFGWRWTIRKCSWFLSILPKTVIWHFYTNLQQVLKIHISEKTRLFLNSEEFVILRLSGSNRSKWGLVSSCMIKQKSKSSLMYFKQ